MAAERHTHWAIIDLCSPVLQPDTPQSLQPYVAEVSNIIALRGGIAMFPLPDSGAFRRMQVGADFFVFSKYNKDAPIDEPTGSDRFLGWEPDVYLNWQITSDVTLAVRYGIFFPGSAILSPDDKPRQFIGAGLTYAF